ncbi:MAG: 4-(cytidine 5'-diphospho)-2-C-methyl-D-erythritol kinase [Pseudomonadota bacterium]
MINRFRPGSKYRAPAKINLCLHVTGRRDDGYHLLDSLVVFADICDWLQMEPGNQMSLAVTGPLAQGVPTDASNLIWKAAALFPGHCTTQITLDKHLPAAAGIGGGSADAALTLQMMADLWNEPLPDAAAQLSLGADVPVCVDGRPIRMQGIGETLTPIDNMPQLGIVLVNPRVGVPTGPVFQSLTSVDNPGLTRMPNPMTAAPFLDWLTDQRNDLQAPAIALCPVVQDVLDALDASGADVTRMSGSGATCFGLFKNPAEAASACDALKARHRNWWISAGRILD